MPIPPTHNIPASYDAFEDRIRAYSFYKARSAILNRSEYFKASLWDIKNKQYSKYILDHLDTLEPRSSHNYTMNQLDETSQKFLVQARREDITRRWNDRKNKRYHRGGADRLVADTDERLRKLARKEEMIEQRRKRERQKNINAKRRHKLETHEQSKVKSPETGNKSQEAKRTRQKTAGRDALEPNRKVNKISNTSRKLWDGKNAGKSFLKLANNRWVRRGAYGLAAMFAFSKIQSIVSGATGRQAIPDNYDKGYDIINSHFTDFGSPVKLWKTAAKTITPYTSSTRRGLRTSVRQIVESNPALDMAKNAIKHNQF